MSDTINFPLAALEQLCNEIDTSASDEIERLTRERDEAREALREIEAAEWKTSGELRGMARKALEAWK